MPVAYFKGTNTNNFSTLNIQKCLYICNNLLCATGIKVLYF